MRLRGKRSRISITDSINEKLDALVSESSTDVYTPKKDKDNKENFLNLIGEDTYFEKSEEEIKKERRQEKSGVVVGALFNSLLVVGVIIGFIVFLGIIFKISM